MVGGTGNWGVGEREGKGGREEEAHRHLNLSEQTGHYCPYRLSKFIVCCG